MFSEIVWYQFVSHVSLDGKIKCAHSFDAKDFFGVLNLCRLKIQLLTRARLPAAFST